MVRQCHVQWASTAGHISCGEFKAPVCGMDLMSVVDKLMILTMKKGSFSVLAFLNVQTEAGTVFR